MAMDEDARPLGRTSIDLALRGQESAEVGANEVGTRSQRAKLEPAGAIADA